MLRLAGPTPGHRYQPVMVYDRARNRTVLYGGIGGASDTWEWDGHSGGKPRNDALGGLHEHRTVRVGQRHDHAGLCVRQSGAGHEAVHEQPEQPTAKRGYDMTPSGDFLGLIPAGQTEAVVTVPSILFVLNWHEELKRLAPTK